MTRSVGTNGSGGHKEPARATKWIKHSVAGAHTNRCHRERQFVSHHSWVGMPAAQPGAFSLDSRTKLKILSAHSVAGLPLVTITLAANMIALSL